MGRAAYLLTPSLWAEPFGAVAIEGLAAGAITILTDRGGLTETTGELGFFFDPDNAESFSAALDAARATFDRHLASPEARAQYEAAVAAHIARFTPAAAVEKIIAAMAP
jgi:glycosyltransferase involved in cell wall biosynthesis